MPSLREVAAELRINVHTVGKAWKELEREGVLVRERGGPYRVGASTEAAEDLLRVDALALLTRGASLGLRDRDVVSLILDLVDARARSSA